MFLHVFLIFQLIYSDEDSHVEEYMVEMRNHGTLPMTPNKETRNHGTEPMTAAHVPRKSKWYPEVGQARSPNIARAKKHVDTVNRKYHPKKPNSSEKLLAPSKHYKKRPKSLTMQKLDNDSRASSVRGPKYVDVEREMEKEQRRLVEERLELEEQRRKFMMGKVQIQGVFFSTGQP